MVPRRITQRVIQVKQVRQVRLRVPETFTNLMGCKAEVPQLPEDEQLLRKELEKVARTSVAEPSVWEP